MNTLANIDLINPEHLLTMSNEDIELHLTQLRDRREIINNYLQLTKKYNNKNIKNELSARLLTKTNQLAKIIDAINTAIEKAEKKIVEVVTLRVQHGDFAALNEKELNGLKLYKDNNEIIEAKITEEITEEITENISDDLEVETEFDNSIDTIDTITVCNWIKSLYPERFNKKDNEINESYNIADITKIIMLYSINETCEILLDYIEYDKEINVEFSA